MTRLGKRRDGSDAAVDAETGEQRLTELLALVADDGNEHRRRPIVQDAGLLHTEAAFEKHRQAARHA
jgi:hypothetical protein